MIGTQDLVRQLHALGVRSGDTVMTHVSLRAVGPLAGGPVSLLEAILAAIGPSGNLMAFVSWRDSPYAETLGADAVPEAIRETWPAFDPAYALCYPGFGAFNAFILAHPGCRRSSHPDASMAAIGVDADWLVRAHRMGSAYGPGSPVERLLHKRGKVLSLGAGPDAVTVLHYAEALARIPGKRRVLYSMPVVEDGARRWLTASDWDSNGILDEYAQPDQPDAIERITCDYLALGLHAQGRVGNAVARLIDANDIVLFGINWLEARHPLSDSSPQNVDCQ